MNLIVILILSILPLVSFIAFVLIEDKYDNAKGFMFTVTMVFMVCNIVLIVATIRINRDNPTALDVYQGKTTLKYTVVDSTITDSTVIFKEDW